MRKPFFRQLFAIIFQEKLPHRSIINRVIPEGTSAGFLKIFYKDSDKFHFGGSSAFVNIPSMCLIGTEEASVQLRKV